MKKFLVVALIMFGSLYAQEAVNLIYNPGFEVWDTSSTGQDSMPRFWHFYLKSGISATAEKVSGFSGFGAMLNITGDVSGYDAEFYHYVLGVDTLSFSGDSFLAAIKVFDADTNIRVRLYCRWQDTLNAILQTDSTDYTVDSTGWQELFVKSRRPDGAVKYRFQLRIYKRTNFQGLASVIVDDAYFGPFLSSVSEESRFDLTIPKLVYSVLNLEFGQISPLEISLSLYDATGRFLQNLYKGRVVSRSMSFDMSNLNRGIYFIFVESAAERKVYRIIKL